MENINVLKYLTDSNIAEFIIAILLVTLVYALIRNGIKAKSKKKKIKNKSKSKASKSKKKGQKNT